MIQIFGTVGPSCDDGELLIRMLRCGMTGVRVNLSHTGLQESADTLRRIRAAFREAGRPPCILIDMQGPEMRIGTLGQPILLCEGSSVRMEAGFHSVRTASMDEAAVIPLQKEIFSKLEPGQMVKLDDGRLLLRIGSISDVSAEAEVIRGGRLLSRKSLAIEGVESDLPALTEEDIRNIRLAQEFGVTGLMQPFVRGRADLCQVREILRRHDAGNLRIYAKIENMRGVHALDEILPEADEIIIARGDLGNAMPLWELPAIQKHIASRCRACGKPFMVVTQMLSSMEHSKVPTRAEVSDIFNAVMDGASSVMVTGETAAGEYPVEVIEYLAKTCAEAERYRSAGGSGRQHSSPQ